MDSVIPQQVVHIVRNANIGGSEVLVKSIINTNEDNGFQHYMLYSNPGSLLGLIESSKKEQIIKVGYKNRLHFILSVRRAIKIHGFDIVHTHQQADELYALLATLGMKVNVFRSFHGYSGVPKKQKKISFKQRIILWLRNKRVKGNFFVSKNLKDAYIQRVKKANLQKQFVLYNGVEYSLGYSSKVEIGKENKGNTLQMGMVGSFTTKGRDQLTICKALKLLNETQIPFNFYFIGNNEGRGYNRYIECYNYCQDNELAEKVFFLGQRADAKEIVKGFDIYIHSANYETFGMSLVEAMYAGIPAIVSDIPTFVEISQQGKYATLFKQGDYEELFLKMKELVGQLKTEHVIKKAEETQEYVRANFSIERHIELLHNYYKQTAEV